jgi:beta-xylosidase
VKKLLFILSILLPTIAISQNPFITSIYTADPSAHVWADGRLYVYPSHDIDPARGCDLMDRYHVFSTGDMVHWRDEGEILNAGQVTWGRKEGGFMWAPDCAYKNGTYYFYFPHPSGTNWDTTWKVGIATSKKPGCDFTSVGYIEGLRGRSMIDPCVFADDDGKAYIYWGGGARCEAGRLKDNMSELDGPMERVTGLVDFHEATWVFKRNGIYYLTYADNNPKENQLRYATSNSPLGPWTYRGVFLGTTGCDTNHGSVIEYKGQWYVFYHNQSISNTGKGNLRSICVDLVNFNDDGSIQLVKQTKTGPPPVTSTAKTKAARKYEAEKAATGGGATIAKSANSGGSYVTGLDAVDAYIEFNKVKGEAKDGRVTIRVYHANSSYAKIRLIVNGTDYSNLNALPTTGVESFTGVTSLTVKLNKGANNTIKLIGGNGKVNIDYITTTSLD